MTKYNQPGPIVAISTGLGEKSALGIVRVSGCKDLSFLNHITKKPVSFSPAPRKAYFSRFYDSKNDTLDEGLFIFFKGPESFTGEDTVEFNLHGNPLILNNFCQYLVSEFGFRLAEPGEFSFRALQNEKLNLTQIEGLDLILNANSGFGLKAGTELLNNDVFKSYKELKSLFLEIKMSLEILIDFSEDVGEEEIFKKLDGVHGRFSKLINKLFNRTQGNIEHLLSPSVSLFGATNAGKSTFFNMLLGDNRAIVSNIHGTTRDYISEFIYLNGTSFKLIDTAGLRVTHEEVETLGIERTYKINEESFFKIFVINPFDDLVDYEGLLFDAIVFTHADLPGVDKKIQEISKTLRGEYYLSSGPKSGPMGAENSGPIGPKKNGPMGATFSGSIGAAFKFDGPIGPETSLENKIFEKYQQLTSTNPIAISRHRDVITDIYETFNEYLSTYGETRDCAILSSYANRLGASLDELIGVVSPQEVLDSIFSNFCIGK